MRWSQSRQRNLTVQEMAGEHGGHQPVLAVKQGNACGAKGLSQEIDDKD